MPINNLTFTIDNNGITLQGSLNGSTRPDISPLLNNLNEDNRLIVHSKEIYIPGNINRLTNPSMVLPLSFGENKFIIDINGEIYFPKYDFENDYNSNNIIKWLNERSINPIDKVNVWGAGNSYTSQGITFEVIDLKNSSVFTDGAQPKIKLNFGGSLDLNPYNQNSIYLVINRKIYKPGIDFTYSESNKEITWLIKNSVPIIASETLCFAFYYNNKNTAPFKLGQRLSRNVYTVEEDGQEDFEIASPPKSSLNSGSNLFYDEKRYSYSNDYYIQSPKLYIQNNGKLKNNLTTNHYLDLSYFKDGNAYSPIIIISQELTAGTGTDSVDSNVYLTSMVPANQISPTNKKVLVFFRGAFAFGESYDNGNIGTLYSGTLPEYTRDNNYIKWKSNRILNHEIVPTSSDWFDIVSFSDSLSLNHLNIEYFKRTNLGNDSFTLQKEVKQGKAILFYNGEPTYLPANDFEVNQADKKIIESLPYSRPTSSRFDDIAVLYVSNDAYGNILHFDYKLNSQVAPSGSEHVFDNPISNKEGTILFVGPRRLRFSDYELVQNNPNALKINVDISANTKIMLVHT